MYREYISTGCNKRKGNVRRKIELLEEEKKGRGCYTSVSDVLNTVSKRRRSILASRSIIRAVRSAI